MRWLLGRGARRHTAILPYPLWGSRAEANTVLIVSLATDCNLNVDGVVGFNSTVNTNAAAWPFMSISFFTHSLCQGFGLAPS